MTTESFTFWNSVGFVDHNTDTGPWNVVSSGQNFSPQLDDIQDGASDGMTAPGDDLSWPSLGSFIFIGLTAAGDPIISTTLGPFGDTYVMSDTDLSGTMVSAVDTSSTYMYCFGAGTQIATPTGETAVETLSIGDDIITADQTRVAVKWVGRQTVRTASAAARMQLVRISAGALGGGVPHSDLVVTADHGMVFPSRSGAVGGSNDGHVINASALINGETIDWVPMAELGETFTVYHVETEHHDVIFANGAAAETFIDMAGRRGFDNYQEYLDLYGADRIIRESPMPRISTARLVPQAVRDRLATGTFQPRMTRRAS